MKQILLSFPIVDVTGLGASPSLRLAADDDFQASTKELHLAGDYQTNCRTLSLTVVGTTASTSDEVIDTTDDSTNPNATYSLYLMNSRGEYVRSVFERWAFTASWGDSVDWQRLEAFNVNRVPLRDDQSYSKRQTDALLTSMYAPDASDTVKGKYYKSFIETVTTALLPGASIAGRVRRLSDGLRGLVFDTGTHWINLLQGNVSIEEYATFAAMLSDIGSTERTVYIPASYSVSASASVPSNITLKFTGSGTLDIASGQTVTIQGQIEAPDRQIFTGSGSVSLTGVAKVVAAWFAGDFGQKITAAKNALPSTGGIVDALSLKEAQSLSATLTIDKPYTRVRFGSCQLDQSTYQIIVPPGTDEVRLLGNAFTFLQTALFGTKFTYTGNGSNILIGDANSQTFWPVVENITLYANNSAAGGLKAVNTLHGKFHVRAMSPAGVTGTGAGIEIAGGAGTPTTYAADNEIVAAVNGFKYSVHFTGAGAFACNGNHVKGGSLSAHGAASSYGVRVDNGDSNTIEGTDIEGYGTGIYTAVGTRAIRSIGVRMESIGAYLVDANGGGGWFEYLHPDPTDGATINNTGNYNSFIDPYTPSNTKIHLAQLWNAIGLLAIDLFDANRSVQLNAYDDLPQTGAVAFNKAPSSGTGGALFYSGGSPSVLEYRIKSDGVYPETDNSKPCGLDAKRWATVRGTTGKFDKVLTAAGPQWTSGAGSPEGAVTAVVGSLYTRTDGGAGTSLYVKESGSGNTGWAAK